METKVNLPLVGAFVLLLGAVLVASLLWLASGGMWQQKYTLYLAIEEESVTGLNLNAPVKYNGVDIGKVSKISLDPQFPQRVNLLLAIERDTVVKQDTVAILKAQGITGIAYVELSGGTRDAAPLQILPGAQYPVITTKASLSTRLENILTRVLAKLDTTSGNLDAFLSTDNQKALHDSLADVARLTHTLAARAPSIDHAISDAGTTLRYTASSSTHITPALAAITRGAAAVEQSATALTQAVQGADRAVQSIGADAQRIDSETLPALTQLMAELNVLSASLRRLSEQTERSPTGLVFGHSTAQPGPGETATEENKP